MNLARNLLTPRERMIFTKTQFSERMWWVSAVLAAIFFGVMFGMWLHEQHIVTPKCAVTLPDGRRLMAHHIQAGAHARCVYEAPLTIRGKKV